MPLFEEFQSSGNFLFKRRSYFPLLLISLFLIALRNFHYPHHQHSLDRLWELICLPISFLGFGIRMLTLGYVPTGTSGRTTAQPSAATLNTTGIYSIVRHPLYLGNFLIWLGICLSIRIWWFTVISVLFFWIYYERIMFAEEEFLRKKFGEHFVKWAEKTPAFIPSFRNWQPPNLPFSWKTVLRREYSGFFAIVASFTVLDLVEGSFVKHRLVFDGMWASLFFGSLAVFLVLRTLKKKTKFLNVEGR